MQISVINYKKLNSETFRFDAEYYHPKYLRIESILKQRKDSFTSLQDLGLKIDASAFYPTLEPYYNQGELPFLRVADVDQQIDYDDALTIPEEILKEYKTLKTVNQGDILLTKGGSVGRVGLIQKRCAVTRDLIFINSSKLSKADYIPLFIYTLTDFYNNLLIRSSSLTAQPHLTLTLVKHIPIYRPTGSLKTLLLKLFEQQNIAHELSLSLYQEAKGILLSELGLLNWKPKHRLSFIKNFSDTQASERIDAEYFQPMYEEVVKAVKSSKKHAILGDVVSIKKCIEPGSEAYQDSGIPFLRVSNLSRFGINNDNQQFISEALYDTLKTHQPKKGEILLSKDATPGIAYYLKDALCKTIPSGGILRVAVKDPDRICPEYLTLVLNSAIVQKQIERDAGGSIINHWLVDQVKNTLIPILPTSTQKQISEKVNQSFCDREQSRCLLNIAKRGVEMAIEKSEKDAQNWIEVELKKLKVRLISEVADGI